MDLEPTPSTSLSAPADAPPPDSDMRIEIDYDESDLATVLEGSGEGEGDAAMEEDANSSVTALRAEGEMSVEEGEMQDETAAEEEVVMAEEAEEAVLPLVEETGEETAIAVETPAAEPVEDEVAVSAPVPPTSEIELAPVESVSDLPPTAVLPFSIPTGTPPADTAVLATVSAPSLPLETITEVSSQTGADVATETDAIVEETIAPLQTSTANEVIEATPTENDEAIVETYDHPPPSTVEPDVEAFLSFGDSADSHPLAYASSGSIDSRPAVDKDPLLPIEVPAHASASDSSPRGVPAVFLTHDNTTYSLFHPHRLLSSSSSTSATSDTDAEIRTEADDAPPSSVDEEPSLLLSDPKQHELYYQPVEQLFKTLREQFTEFQDGQDELVLDFDEIGIALGEVRLSLFSSFFRVSFTDRLSPFYSLTGQRLLHPSLPL
jgi:hypothetical protein